MYFPRIEIINGKLGIGACDIENTTQYLQKTILDEEIPIIYWHERDWLILKKGNANYEYYKRLLIEYLQMNDKQRKKLKDLTEIENVPFFVLINQVLRIRRKRYKKKREEITRSKLRRNRNDDGKDMFQAV